MAARAGGQGTDPGADVAVVGGQPHPVLLAVAHDRRRDRRAHQQQPGCPLDPEPIAQVGVLGPAHEADTVVLACVAVNALRGAESRARGRAGGKFAGRPSAVHGP